MNEAMRGKETLEPTPEFLYVLDLDRTLVNTEVSAQAIEQATAKVAQIDLKVVREEIEAAGGTFDPLKYLQDKVADDILGKIRKEFLKNMETRDDFFYEGATVLLGHLESEHTPYIITTYGSKEWQEWKLAAADLTRKDYIITSTERKKGQWIGRDWLQEDGTYAPPLENEEKKRKLTARHVVVVDDKRESFEGLPEGNVSVLVRHAREQILKSQEAGGYEPDIVVSGLWDLDVVVIMHRPERKQHE